MQKVTLTFIKATERTSAKTNKPFTSLSIKTQEHGEKYLSGFQNKDNKDWRVGDTVEIEVKESEKLDKEGKPYLNFETPKKTTAQASPEILSQILTKLGKIDYTVTEIRKHLSKEQPLDRTSDGSKMPNFGEYTNETVGETKEVLNAVEGLK